MTTDRLRYLSAGSLIALIFLCLAWELWLAPLRPGGSWLVSKVLPLLAPLIGILRRRLYTYQWSSMLILAYFAEGVVRGYSETGLPARLARIEIALALLFFFSVIAYVRTSARERTASSAGKSTGSA
ncbi:MAG: DUF2069 domain-containing protein [Burkholderiales bacterium]|nr:DUF2069 domain-containing protein [Burkholderiales bacterium]